MANGTRTWILLIGLAVGVVGGWLLHSPKPVTGGGANPGDHLVNVGPKPGNVGTVLSRAGKHQMFWKPRKLPAGVVTLRILFMKGDYPPEAQKQPPFEGGTVDTDQYFDCPTNGVCKSGLPNPNLPDQPPDYSYYYKYWQQFLDKDGKVIDQADAGLIIQP